MAVSAEDLQWQGGILVSIPSSGIFSFLRKKVPSEPVPRAPYASRQKRLAEIIPSLDTKSLRLPRTLIPQSRIPNHDARPPIPSSGIFSFLRKKVPSEPVPRAPCASRQRWLAEIIPSPVTKSLRLPPTLIPQSRIPNHAARPPIPSSGIFSFLLGSAGAESCSSRPGRRRGLDLFQSRPAGFFHFYVGCFRRGERSEDPSVSIPSSGIFSFLLCQNIGGIMPTCE